MQQKKPKYITRNVKTVNSFRENINTDSVSQKVMNTCNAMDEDGYDVLSIEKLDDMKNNPVKMSDTGTQTVSVLITGVRRDSKKILED